MGNRFFLKISRLADRAERRECAEVEERLWAYVAHGLGPLETQRVERHLDTCEACRQALDASRLVSDGLKAAREQAVPSSRTDWRMLQTQLQQADGVMGVGAYRDKPFQIRSVTDVAIPLVVICVLFIAGTMHNLRSMGDQGERYPNEAVSVESQRQQGEFAPQPGTEQIRGMESTPISPAFVKSNSRAEERTGAAGRANSLVLRSNAVSSRRMARTRLRKSIMVAKLPKERVQKEQDRSDVNRENDVTGTEYVLPAVHTTTEGNTGTREYVMDRIGNNDPIEGQSRLVSYDDSEFRANGTVRELRGW